MPTFLNLRGFHLNLDAIACFDAGESATGEVVIWFIGSAYPFTLMKERAEAFHAWLAGPGKACGVMPPVEAAPKRFTDAESLAAIRDVVFRSQKPNNDLPR